MIELEDRQTPIDPVAGWRRWIGSERGRRGALLISRRAEPAGESGGAASDGADPSRVTLLRHPGLARVVEAWADDAGLRAIEEIGDARPLIEGPRMPKGGALSEQLFGLLQALAYVHAQGLAHGAVSRETVFSDGRRLVLTGIPLVSSGGEQSGDLQQWAVLTEEFLDGERAGELASLLLEAASQVQTAVARGKPLDGARVLRAIERTRNTGGEQAEDDDGDIDGSERSWQMRALLAVVHFIGSVIVGGFTTVLTIAVIGGAVALGVMWFLDQLPRETQVPMVVGMEREEADDRLGEQGLSVGRVRRVYREEIEPGHVAETVPPPGMNVREGREITLVVSMGAARVKVPRLTGLRLDEARSVLEKQGLRLVDGGEVRATAPKGEIVEQDPPPGRKIAQGDRVVAQTSGGPEFGILEVPGEGEDDGPRRIVFRRVAIVVPRGDALQRVVVREGYGEDLETTYDRLHRPGDRVKLDTWGRPGKIITVSIEGERVFKTQL